MAITYLSYAAPTIPAGGWVNMLVAIAAFIVFFAFGTLLTVRPDKVRDFIFDASLQGRWGFWFGRERIMRRVKKRFYLFELRLIGIGCLCGAVICAWIIFAPKAPLS